MRRELQTILIPIEFGLGKAIKWLRDHDYKTTKVDIGELYYRFRQTRPVRGARYSTIKLPNGVDLVFQAY